MNQKYELEDQLEELRKNYKAMLAADPHGKDLLAISDQMRAVMSELEGWESQREPSRPDVTNSSRQVEGPTASFKIARGRQYRDMFPGEPLSNGGFKSFDEFITILQSGRHDSRLQMETRAMGESIGSAGGFSVPEEFAAWLLDASLENEIIRPRCQVWPMNSDTRKVPGWDAGNHTSSLYGGFYGQWLAEHGTATETEGKLRLIQLTAKKLGIYSSASNELVSDGLSFEEQLKSALVKSVGWFLDFAAIQGSGAGKPLGLLSDPALIVIGKESGQTASTIVYQNTVNMFARMAPQCLGDAVWIANSNTLPQLLTMTLTDGTTTNFVPAVTMQGGRFYLLGKEILLTEKCPALGSQGDIIFAALNQYALGLRREVSLDKSNAPGWLRDEQSYRAILRADGQGTWNKVISPKHGDTLSWVVTLEARA